MQTANATLPRRVWRPRDKPEILEENRVGFCLCEGVGNNRIVGIALKIEQKSEVPGFVRWAAIRCALY